MEAVAEVRAGEAGVARAREPAQLPLGRERPDRVERMRVGEPGEHVLLGDLLVQRHAVVAVGLEPLEPVQVVGERRAARRRRCGSSTRRAPRATRGRNDESVCRTVSLRV